MGENKESKLLIGPWSYVYELVGNNRMFAPLKACILCHVAFEMDDPRTRGDTCPNCGTGGVAVVKTVPLTRETCIQAAGAEPNVG